MVDGNLKIFFSSLMSLSLIKQLLLSSYVPSSLDIVFIKCVVLNSTPDSQFLHLQKQFDLKLKVCLKMATWYFCSLCIEGHEECSALDLWNHIQSKHKCSGWSKFNGHSKKQCLINYHFDLMNPQERTCNLHGPLRLKCYICSKIYASSNDYVNCVHRHCENEADTSEVVMCDDFLTQDDHLFYDAPEHINQVNTQFPENDDIFLNHAMDQVITSDGFPDDGNDDIIMEVPLPDEMLTQDDIYLDCVADYVEECIRHNGKFNIYNCYYLLYYFLYKMHLNSYFKILTYTLVGAPGATQNLKFCKL